MLYPSVKDLTNDKVNNYMLVIAAAKGARYLTYKKNQEQEAADPHKEYEKIVSTDDDEEKAVSAAVKKIHSGEFKIITE